MKKFIIFMFVILIPTIVIGFENHITFFPLDNYDQNLEHWIKPSDIDYDQLLISAASQEKFCHEFYRHYFATDDDSFSPWSPKYAQQELKKKIPNFPESICLTDNEDSPSVVRTKEIYGTNYQPYSEEWLANIIRNINLPQFRTPSVLIYDATKRGIAVKNLLARSLPTIDPVFYDPGSAGEGYPFDNLQESAVWVGTPVYIIGKSQDEQWYYVLTPHLTAWVPSDGIAKTSENFIEKWQEHAKKKMVAIIHTGVSIFDYKRQYRFSAFVGMVFPGDYYSEKDSIGILIPIISELGYDAQITSSQVKVEDAAIMPLPATPHNFSTIISTLLGRPFGWGNMYFYNDCSAELQSLYTPFGIWLPRNTYQQSKIGIMVDKTSDSPLGRIEYLREKGKKFTTLVNIGGHIMLYLGNFPNPQSNCSEPPMIMTYQNTWGLKPENGSYRAVIGKSVLFPLLLSYPEDLNLASLAARRHFLVNYLDDEPVFNSVDLCIYPDE